MKEFELIVDWARERNLIEGATPKSQMVKLFEEFGELAAAIARQDIKKIQDSVGDCVVVMTIICAQLGFDFRKGPEVTHNPSDKQISILKAGLDLGFLAKDILDNGGHGALVRCMFVSGHLQVICNNFGISFEECVQIAYNEIKDRKGKMVDGVFVKEE